MRRWTAANWLLDRSGSNAGDGGASVASAPGEAGDGSGAARGSGERLCGRGGVERGRARIVAICWPWRRRIGSRRRAGFSINYGRLVPGRDETRDDDGDPAIGPGGLSGSRGEASAGWRTAVWRRAVRRGCPDCRHEFLVAVDIEDRRDRGLPLVRLAAPIEPEWLLDRAAGRTTLEWNRTAERVEQVSALVYDQLTIEETRAPAPASEEASKLLATKALDVDIGRFVEREALDQLLARANVCGDQDRCGGDADGALPWSGRVSPKSRICSRCCGRRGLIESRRSG